MLKPQSSTNLAIAHRRAILQMLTLPMIVFSDKLQKIMEEKGVSPTVLSERTGIALAHISQLRHGKRNPSRKTLERLASALNVTVDELLSNKPRPTAKEYPTEFDKEVALFREEARKYGTEGVRLARELLPVILKNKSKR